MRFTLRDLFWLLAVVGLAAASFASEVRNARYAEQRAKVAQERINTLEHEAQELRALIDGREIDVERPKMSSAGAVENSGARESD
jgi:hypothetical protein